ncbi:heme ABC transporter permease [Pseudolabrys sp. FHR47]|uniref:heme ABC transporter permease n=1 Tax=Pseudolabrys sp. FHR47 TaxID=2562284 RepID=UPI0010BEAFF7|nr:heme ABC transporter permease [Pseudolabrys sp. FHR47]
MAAYHVVLVHFPIALWMTATLAILWRAVSNGPVALAIDRAMIPLLSVGLASGIIAVTVGLMVWPWDAISTSPMGRNHILLAAWTVAYWTLLLVTRSIQGEAIWDGPGRWVMAGLAILGSALLGITGTLGGHLAGIYTDLSAVLRALGWEVHRTFYVPNLTLGVIVAAAVALIAIGWLASRQHESGAARIN